MSPEHLSPTSNLQDYVRRVRRRLRVQVASLGLGAVGLSALVLTVIFVYIANRFAFSDTSVISARTLLFGGVLFVLIAALLRPLFKLERKKTAGHIEKSEPAFDGRIQTFVDQTGGKGRESHNPLLDLLAEDALRVAENAPAERVVSTRRILGFVSAGTAAVLLLLWLGSSGPGYWGYGAARLWGGWLKPSTSPLYQIVVQPGDATVRQGADLVVTSQMIGFDSPSAKLFAKFKSSVDWEETTMPRQFEGTGFEFLFAGVREPFEYYISAGGIHSETFKVDVVEMPQVENVKLTYRYPDWTGLEDRVEDPGADIRAVAGTEVEVEVSTNKPLPEGVLRIDEQHSTSLSADGLVSTGRIEVKADGAYFVAARYNGELVRLTDDYFITVLPDEKPSIQVVRPGRDYKSSNIEEVVSEFEASDDFGLTSFEVRYSVNGGEERRARLAIPAGGKQASARHTFYLEELGPEGPGSLVPGDLVSYYGIAKDHELSAQTDIYFIEVQPYDREFYQVQQRGGMGGAQQGMRNEISRRQKEIIAATWNLIRKSERASESEKAEIRDNAIVLSDVQLTLRDQANKLAERARAREIAGTNKKFKNFVENLEKAAENMTPAADHLSETQLRDAIPPAQKALQYILRAESIFREIQLAFGSGSGGGGGGQALDLAEMFEIEMDLHKNQYETEGGAAGQQLEREIDEALEKLRELARRQQQLADRRRQQERPSFAERWQQEMLRREALELKRRLEELQRRQQAQTQSGRRQQAGQQGQQQSGQQQSGQSSGQQQQQANLPSGQQSGLRGSPNNLRGIINRLDQATREMEANPSSGAEGSRNRLAQAQDEASARRAQKSLQEALREIEQQRRQQAASTLSELSERTERLVEEQGEIADRIQQDFRQAIDKWQRQQQNKKSRRVRLSSGLSPQEALDLSRRKADMQQELEDVEREIQQTMRRFGQQRETSQKLREALSDIQQSEVSEQLGRAAELIRRGYAPYQAQNEEGVTRALQQLNRQMREAERLASAEGQGREAGLERSLARLEDLRRRLEQARGPGRDPSRRERSQQGGQQSGQQPGQQGQGQSAQQGSQQGQQAQSGQEGQSGQSASQQGQSGQGQQASNQGSSSPGQQGGQQPGGGEARGGSRGGPIGGPQWSFGSASNYGTPNERGGYGAWNPRVREEMERALREGVEEVPPLTQQLRAGGVYEEDLDEIRKFVRGLGNSRFAGNPKLLAEEYRKMLALLEQLELQVRRQVEEDEQSEVRAMVAEPVPERYREAVAEYFRRLSQGK